jgi:hypothetical protein
VASDAVLYYLILEASAVVPGAQAVDGELAEAKQVEDIVVYYTGNVERRMPPLSALSQ